jgi:hypothetical protein
MARAARGDRRQRFREEPPASVPPARERLVYIDRARLLSASLTLNLILFVVLLITLI